MESFELFHGSLSPIAAQIYVRFPSLPGGDCWSLAGTLRGPSNDQARTLPATYRLRDLGSGPTLLGSAQVTDPSFWTPESPALYRLQVSLLRAGAVQETAESDVGFCPLGTQGGSFRLADRRWVLRGIAAADFSTAELSELRAMDAAAVVVDPQLEFCRRASRLGVFVVAQLTDGDMGQRIRQLSQEPAVSMLVLPRGGGLGSDWQAANVLLAGAARGGEPQPLPDSDDLVFWSVGPQDARCPFDRTNQPVVAVRALETALPLREARRECDRLQRDLAATHGDFAGYVVVLPGSRFAGPSQRGEGL